MERHRAIYFDNLLPCRILGLHRRHHCQPDGILRFSLALSNVVTGLSGTLPILQLAGGLAYEAHNTSLRVSAPVLTAHGVYCCRLVFFRCCCRGTAGAR